MVYVVLIHVLARLGGVDTEKHCHLLFDPVIYAYLVQQMELKAYTRETQVTVSLPLTHTLTANPSFNLPTQKGYPYLRSDLT